jgi:hypothetical protein
MRDRLSAAIESLALALWIGALAGFAFVFAPIAFHTVTNSNEFASLIGAVLTRLGVAGAACGIVATAAALLRGSPSRSAAIRAVLYACMIGLSVYVTAGVIPHMEATAAALGAPITSIAKGDPRRVRYDALHAASSRLYSLVLLMGTAAIVMAAVEREGRRFD